MPAPVESRRRVRLVGRTKTMGMTSPAGTKTEFAARGLGEHVCKKGEDEEEDLQDGKPRVLRPGQGEGGSPPTDWERL